MKTDYDARGFAARYRASRPLDADAVGRWATILREETPIAVGTVLDLGAGVGRFWPVFRRAWAPTRIVAVDRSAEMLDASGRGPDVETVVADLDALDPMLCRPQVAFCSMSLHYSGDPTRVCAVVRSMLSDGGVLLVRTSTREIAGASAMLRFFPSAVAAEAAAFSPRGDIEGWMREAGFAVHSRVVVQPAAAEPCPAVAPHRHSGAPRVAARSRS